ncbi:MAG: hypothetical protein HYY91_02975 [Candidatus Omnitrophica bacterium]|nr:hypothetical protein [Candidatus Omnitrophota bacterium]
MMRLSQLMMAVALCGMAGCSPPGQSEKLRKEVLSADPPFAKVLDRRDELADKITLLQRELALKKSTVERRVAQLRAELREAKREVAQKVRQTAVQLKPEQERVELAVGRAAEELKTKRAHRDGLARSISRIRKALGDKSATWTAADRSRLAQELDDLARETQRLDQELAVLAKHLRLLKAKRLLLRL